MFYIVFFVEKHFSNSKSQFLSSHQQNNDLFFFLLYRPGETKTTVLPYVPGGVSDGQWHSVQLHYYNKVNTTNR